MTDDLEVGQLVENSRIDQPRHGGRGLVGPAEAEPDFVLRFLLAGVVGKLRGAHRMHPHGELVRRHALEHRAEFCGRQRLAGNIGENLDPARTEFLHGAVGLLDRSLDVVHRQRSDERREMIGMPAANLGQRVVGHPHQVRRPVRRADQLGRRVGQRQHVLHLAEFIDQCAARVDVPQRPEAGERAEHRMARDQVAEAIEIRLGHEMVENVDHHAGIADSSGIRSGGGRPRTWTRGGQAGGTAPIGDWGNLAQNVPRQIARNSF